MKLTHQAMGAMMMALQKCLIEQRDILPLLEEMNFQVNPDDPSHSTLIITNPPVVTLEGVELDDAVLAVKEESEFEPTGC